MRNKTYELSNVSFDDKNRKNDYLITHKKNVPQYKFKMPNSLNTIRKIYPGDHTTSTCIRGLAEPLSDTENRFSGKIIL